MKAVEIELFGALRDVEAGGVVRLETRASTIGELRADIVQRALAWPEAAQALLPRCAFASRTTVLRDGDPLPEDGRLALLPPVSGG